MAKLLSYIGTYSKGEGNGVLVARIDDETASLEIIGSCGVENPSHVALSPDGKFLYASIETAEFEGKNGGAVAAMKVEEDGQLTLINTVGTQGKHPCYVAASPNGKFVYAANYSEGTATVYATDNGALCEDPMIVVHQGTGTNPQRQEKPHVHITRITPDGKYLAVCDLGIDAVVLYPLCDKCGLNKNAGSFVRTAPGQGPRHIEFSKDGKYAYVVTEMGCTVRAYEYNDGKLTFLSEVGTLPEGFEGYNIDAAIHFAPDGKTLAVSNRGDDSLALYDVCGGSMTLKQIVKVGGKTPREFAYTPNGRFVFVCNQDSADITVLSVKADGTMELTDKKYPLPKPVSLIWR